MLDGTMRKLIDPPLNKFGTILAASGVSANAMTLGGLLVGLASAVCIAFGFFTLGLVLILFSRLADGLDGAVARATTKTDFGGFIDIVADFLFYGAVPLAFGFANPEANALVAGVLLLAFYVNGATFLGYAILAERNNMQTRSRGDKNLYFTDGLLEGTETIVFFLVLCIWPDLFVPLASVFAALAFYTASMRVWRAYSHFSSPIEIASTECAETGQDSVNSGP